MSTPDPHPSETNNSHSKTRRIGLGVFNYLRAMSDVTFALTTLISICGISLFLLYRAIGAL